MEQAVFILIVAVASFVQWLIKKSAEQREARKREGSIEANEPIDEEVMERPLAPYQQDAEAARRLREAFGLPDEEVLVQREPVVYCPPPIMVTPPPVSRIETPARSRVTERPKKQETLVEVPKKSERATVREMLKGPQGLREAMVLSEVLGPPKAFL